MELFNINHLEKIFHPGTEQEVPALVDVSFNVKRESFVALVGVSGSGKSTLLNILAGLENPTNGEYIFDGKDVFALSNKKLAELRNYDISMIPQSYGLILHQSVYNNISLPLFLNKTIKRHDIESMTLSCLEEVGLADKSKKKVCELSGGEQQRVAIARAIVCRPQMILADEPTGALDRANTEKIMELLENLNHNHKITIMIATHDPLVFNNCRDVIRLENGHVI